MEPVGAADAAAAAARLPLELVQRAIASNVQLLDLEDIQRVSLACKGLRACLAEMPDPEGLGAWLGRRLGAQGLKIDGIDIADTEAELERLRRRHGFTKSGDAALRAPCSATAAAALLAWPRAAGLGPAQLTAALLAALREAGAPAEVVQAARAAASAPPPPLPPQEKLAPWARAVSDADGRVARLTAGAEPTAPERAAAAAFVEAARRALGPRALLLAPFAAAGGRAGLADAIAADALGRCCVVLKTPNDFTADPQSTLGFGDLAYEKRRDWHSMLRLSCAAAAARAGRADACLCFLDAGPAAERAGEQRACRRAAAAGGRLAALEALGAYEDPETRESAFYVLARNGQAEALRGFIARCTQLRLPYSVPLAAARAPPAARAAGRVGAVVHTAEGGGGGVLTPCFLAEICAQPRGADVLRALHALDDWRAAALWGRAGGGARATPERALGSAAMELPYSSSTDPETASDAAASLVAALAPPACLEAHLRRAGGAAPHALLGAAHEAEAMLRAAPELAPALSPLLQAALRGAAEWLPAGGGGGDEGAGGAEHWREALQAAALLAVGLCCADSAAAVLEAARRAGELGCLAAVVIESHVGAAGDAEGGGGGGGLAASLLEWMRAVQSAAAEGAGGGGAASGGAEDEVRPAATGEACAARIAEARAALALPPPAAAAAVATEQRLAVLLRAGRPDLATRLAADLRGKWGAEAMNGLALRALGDWLEEEDDFGVPRCYGTKDYEEWMLHAASMAWAVERAGQEADKGALYRAGAILRDSGAPGDAWALLRAAAPPSRAIVNRTYVNGVLWVRPSLAKASALAARAATAAGSPWLLLAAQAPLERAGGPAALEDPIDYDAESEDPFYSDVDDGYGWGDCCGDCGC
ncbi:MAG: hypothetical protein J3K34DRAFT_500139 [Monoraphidium minutum]|nr:MAG: hypothetical protein J3K34DRAFT_500139 [Monoraphidium minutum]